MDELGLENELGVEESEGLQIEEYIDVVKRRLLLLIAIALVVSIGMLMRKMSKPPVYIANGVLLIDSGSARRLVFPGSQIDTIGGDEYLNTQVKLLKSRRMARLVIEELKIVDFRDKSVPDPEQPAPLDSRVRLLKAEEASIQNAWISAAIDRFQNYLSVRISGNTRLVEVSYESSNPEMAANIINTLFRQYINFNLQSMSGSTKQLSDFFTQQIADLRKELSKKEKELQEYSKKNELFYLSGKDSTVVEKFAELNRAYTAAQVFRVSKESIYRELKSKPYEEYPQVKRDGLIQGLYREYLNMETKYQQMSQTFKDSYPEMKRLKSQMINLQERILTESQEIGKRVLAEAEVEYQSALKKENSLTDLLNKQKSSVVTTNTSAINHRSLQIEIDNMRKLLSEMVRKQSETMISSRMDELQTSNIRVVDWAEIPMDPKSGKKLRTFIMPIGMGFGFAFAVIFGLDFLFKTVYTPKEAERHFKMRCLGAVPGFGFQKKPNTFFNFSPPGYLKPVEPPGKNQKKSKKGRLLKECLELENTFTEDYRNIRTALLFRTTPPQPKIISFTAARRGDGITATTANLAVSLTRLEHPVLIIDANLHRPAMHTCFDIPQSPGLSSLLKGEHTFEQVLTNTHIENLSLIPSGPVPDNPSELLNSTAMSNLMKKVKEKYDYVLIDSPACNGIMDPIIVAHHADAVIMVTWGGATLKRTFEAARDNLKQYPRIRLLGVILNKMGMKGLWDMPVLKNLQTLFRKIW